MDGRTHCKRSLALFALLALWLAGCARCESKVEFESFVSVPTELRAVEKLDDPPDVTVKVEKRAAPKGGGGGCGHSPVCIIIIPFAIADALFPEKLRIATVSEKGRETYHAVFRENGQFVQALAFEDGVWKKVALLQLVELRRNLVVEVARASADAEGKPGKFAWSSLQKQVDVLSGYRALFTSTSDTERRRRIIAEMLTHAGSDALPVAKERLVDPSESSLVKSSALGLLCDRKAPVGSAADRTSLLHELAQAKPDAQTSSAALACFDPKQPEAATAFTARIVEAACAEKFSSAAQELVQKIVTWGVSALAEQSWRVGGAGVRASVEPFVERCAADERRAFLRFMLGFEQDQAELSKLVASKDAATASAVVRGLNNENPTHRAILLAELEREGSPIDDLTFALGRDRKEPDAAEARALAGAFILRAKEPKARGSVLSRLEQTPKEQRAEARKRIEQKLTHESEPERAALHASLVVLGDHEHEAGAARALRARCAALAEARAHPAGAPSAAPAPSSSSSASASGERALKLAEIACGSKLPWSYREVEDTPGLVAVVLRSAGCSEGELLELAASRLDAKAPERGRVCKSEPP